MKPRLLFGIIFMVAFTSLVMYNFSGSIGSYVNFEQASYRFGSETHVIGTWVKDMPHGFNNQTRTFNFHMMDEEGNVRRVVYNNAKPQNFEDAIQLVVKGKMKNDVFYSDDMLVKCPSKYNDQSLETMTAGASS
ncbi:MAG: cytochrome c-type biogenesis heme chaperone CcmE [Bacteroidetes bacterium HLUCCA01]|nr:MAG: cytochrome c-type biogenesis heme chaperone CcmE [Bacteroidetes bacterium HLUCCA01]